MREHKISPIAAAVCQTIAGSNILKVAASA